MLLLPIQHKMKKKKLTNHIMPRKWLLSTETSIDLLVSTTMKLVMGGCIKSWYTNSSKLHNSTISIHMWRPTRRNKQKWLPRIQTLANRSINQCSALSGASSEEAVVIWTLMAGEEESYKSQSLVFSYANLLSFGCHCRHSV